MYDKIAQNDFERAHSKAFWKKVRSWFTGGKNELVPYDAIRNRIPFRGQHDLGLQEVPIDQIIGSVGRFLDFDREFLPVQTRTRQRWENIDKAHYQDIILPPVELIKIGEIYFVKDGNHRISVARERGQVYVDSYVTEIAVPGPVHSEEDLDQLVIAEEKNVFFETTNLDVLEPDASFSTVLPGQYQKILEHISAHRWYLGERRGQEISNEEAVVSWYNNIYFPVVKLIQQHELKISFPGYSELDLYLWIMEYQWHLREMTLNGLDDVEKEALNKVLAEHSDQAVRKLIITLMSTNLFDEITAKLDYARFMEQTQLMKYRAGVQMDATLPGAYDRLLEHIAAHKWFLGERVNREASYEEALLSWYDTVYAPLVTIIREHDVLSTFQDRTETDLYLWIIERQWLLKEKEGIEATPEETADNLIDEQITPVKKVIRAILPSMKAGDDVNKKTQQEDDL